MINIKDAQICWNDNDTLEVVSHGEGDYRRFNSDTGASCVRWKDGTDNDRLLKLMWIFKDLTVNHGLDANDVHREFSKINEYCEYHYWLDIPCGESNV